jgi:DNA-binding protein
MIDRRIVLDENSACRVYRAYILNADGHFMNVVELFCRTDEEALEQARGLAVSRAVEVWANDRKVAYIPAP